jgi:uncharacterized protein YecE (DUF72 family)
MSGRILVGTSSWADPGFVEDWYPAGMPPRERLPWYAQHFEFVEVNSSFYGIPDRNTVERWVSATPDHFTFDYKLHRLLSRHAAPANSLPKDMQSEVEVNQRGRVLLTSELENEVIDRTLEAAAPLVEAGKLGAFLLQLTPAFAPRKAELEDLAPLVERFRPHLVAVEFRHKGWVEGEQAERTFSFLSETGAVYVSVDAPPEEHVPIMPPIDAVTNEELAYMRLHGRNTQGYLSGKTVAERFGWVYTDDELHEVEGRVKRLAEDAGAVHVAFNNNRSDDAPTAAQRFRDLLGQDPGPPPEGEQLRIA